MRRPNQFPWCDRTNSRGAGGRNDRPGDRRGAAQGSRRSGAVHRRDVRHQRAPSHRLLEPRAHAPLGWAYDDVVGKSCGGMLAGVDDYGNRYCSDDCPVVSIATRGDAVRQFRLRARAKSGEKLAVEITVLKFMLPQGNGMLLVHVVRPAAAEPVALPLDQREEPAAALDPRLGELTARELEVLSLLSAGEKTRVIADRLGIAPLTARNHINNMFEKLDVHSKAEAIALAYRMHV